MTMMLLLTSMFCYQEVFTHYDSGLNFELPAGWTYTQEGDHFEATSPDESVILLFFVENSTDAEIAAEGAAELIDELFKDVDITNGPDYDTVNGLDQAYMEGDGLFEGEQMDWDLTLVCGRKKSMVIIALGDILSMQKTMDRIYESISN